MTGELPPEDEDWHIETWDLLDSTLQSQEDDYRKAFGLDGPEPSDPDLAAQWRLAQRLDQLATKLVESVAVFTISEDAATIARELAPGDAPKYSLRSLVGYNVVQQRIAIELAGDAIGRLHDAEKRLLMLLPALRDHPLSPTASSYVDRAVRLFLAGFGPECVVMCRSALDSALTHALPDDRVADLLGRAARSRHGFMLADRIDAARTSALLNKDEAKAAHLLREWGRQAVHLSPGLAPKPEAAIITLLILLAKILPDDPNAGAA